MASPARSVPPVIEALQACRAREKEQALFYRALASLAEDRGDTDLAERLHGLHADEQHHVSRISARLLELGAVPPELRTARPSSAALADWETVARQRERDEIAGYEALLQEELDRATRALLAQILETEQHHVTELGGKWTPA